MEKSYIFLKNKITSSKIFIITISNYGFSIPIKDKILVSSPISETYPGISTKATLL
jgi:hypothetical protein